MLFCFSIETTAVIGDTYRKEKGVEENGSGKPKQKDVWFGFSIS